MMQDSLGTSPAMDKLNEPLLINDEEVEEVPSTPTPLFLAPVDESKNRRTQTQKLKIHKRHVKQAIIFFSCLTAAFVILAIVSRNTNEDKYSPPTCTECKVIGSVASNIAQGILPVVYLSALYVSWYNESPRRSLRQFVIDNFKQVVSGSITHFEATGFAILMFNHNTKVSQCDWYLMLFMLDTAYGCFLTVTTHAFTAQLAARFSWSEPLSRVGDYYGKPWPDGTRDPSTRAQMVWRWVAQTLHWTIVAVIARGVVVGWAYLFRESVGKSAALLGSWACSKKSQYTKTFLNIIFFPILMDAIQVVVQSFALKPDVDTLPSASKSKKESIAMPQLSTARTQMGGHQTVASFA
eukprot:m.45074 g.45074  ORF g.45074 m.45074 type:complete len:352 (-) comp15112_c0_seq3:2759-3814(-)